MPPLTETSPQIESDVVAYQRLSGWAIGAVILGLLSGAAMVGPILWCLPLAGVIVAILALRSISASDGRIIGRNLALLGLVVSIFFGVAGAAHTVSRRVWLDQRAEIVARGFLDLLISNQPMAAHQLTQSAGIRKPLGEDDLAHPYAKNENAKKDYDKFLQLDLVKTLLAAGSRAKIESISSNFYGSDDRSDYVAASYRIALPDNAPPLVGAFVLDRSLSFNTNVEQWRVIPPASKPTE
jgi:hypothetical protein